MKARGFTLIEIMVVLVILGITVTFATLGFQRLEDDRLEKQAGHLSAWLQAISDDAVLDSAVYGVWLARDGKKLESAYFMANRWWSITGDNTRSETLDEGVEIALHSADGWKKLDAVAAEDIGRIPAMVFLPTGLAQPDKLQLKGDDNRTAVIERDDDGLFTWSIQQ